nr:MAG TPA: hypothetical protein [Caudoviricetes sp.]
MSGGFYKNFPTTIRKRDSGRKGCDDYLFSIL